MESFLAMLQVLMWRADFSIAPEYFTCSTHIGPNLVECFVGIFLLLSLVIFVSFPYDHKGGKYNHKLCRSGIAWLILPYIIKLSVLPLTCVICLIK